MIDRYMMNDMGLGYILVAGERWQICANYCHTTTTTTCRSVRALNNPDYEIDIHLYRSRVKLVSK